MSIEVSARSDKYSLFPFPLLFFEGGLEDVLSYEKSKSTVPKREENPDDDESVPFQTPIPIARPSPKTFRRRLIVQRNTQDLDS